MSAPRQVVVLFNEGGNATRTPLFRGGKGAGLADMAALGLPVPPGFTIATSVARAFEETGQLPTRLEGQIRRAMTSIEEASGLEFGNPLRPLLVSVRSGAPVSMPGMMDTVLNVGLQADMLEAMKCSSEDQFATDTYRRFICQFGTAVLGLPAMDQQTLLKETEALVPHDPYEQLMLSIRSVLLSWNSDRAQAYRENQGIPHWWGTAITVQAMAFGNRNDRSATGVVFSHDVNTGAEVLTGEFLVQAQGEDVVDGSHTPLPITQMQDWNQALYCELQEHVSRLSQHLDSMVDVEFTVDDGKLFILQVRRATRTAEAAATFAVHRVWADRWTKVEAVASLSEDELTRVSENTASITYNQSQLIGRGKPAANGCAIGKVVYSSAKAVELAAAGEKVVLVRPDTSPEDLPGMLASVAVVTERGGMSCHAAVVCRHINRPAIVGAESYILADFWSECEGFVVSIDGTIGRIYVGEQEILEAPGSKEIRLILRWSQQDEARTVVFDTLSERHSANAMLASFYMTEAMAREARGSELEAEAKNLSETVTKTIASYFATYLTLAVSGELRHFLAALHEAPRELVETFGFDQLRRESNRQSAQHFMALQLAIMPVEQQARFAELATQAFAIPGMWQGGFGGRMWAMIAKTLHSYLAGEIPAAVFVDAVFDLRHNGGVLFNKHPMFSLETREGQLQRMLNLKKDCKIPEMWVSFKEHDRYSWFGALYHKGYRARLW